MGTYKEQTGRSIEEAFDEFHSKNPKVYKLFCDQCFRAISKNRTKLSSKQILGHIRWEISLETDSDDGFKINDAFTSHYPRLFIKEFPQHQEIFNFRELRDGSEPGTKPKKAATAYQIELLTELYFNKREIWLIGTEYKMVNPESELRYVIRSWVAETLIKSGFIAQTETTIAVQSYKIYIITELGINQVK